MNEQTKQDILAWAQQQVNRMPRSEYGGDWWGAYNNEWDINIWDNGESTGICVTAYPIYADADGDLQTDLSDYIRVGYCKRPDTWPDIEEPDEVTA